MKKNYLGQNIIGRKKFLNDDFGYYDKYGDEHVNWAPPDEKVDQNGFDKTNKEPNGDYIQEVTLPYGKLLCRYGNERGRLTTDIESDYDELGLPYVKETVEYHVYKVVADDLRVQCNVYKGRVAPMFYSKGGAVQYKHFQSIAKEIQQGKLEEVFL